MKKRLNPIANSRTKSKDKRFNWQKHKIISAKEHQLAAKDSINNLSIKARDGKFFILEDGSRCLEFMCCSYLGLDLDPRVVSAGQEHLRKLGVNIAISRTRIRANRLDVLEAKLNKIFCGNYTTVFSSLHVLHAGIIPLIGSGEMPSYPVKENGCTFIVDKYAHASLQLVRGIMKQFGEVVVCDFQDQAKLSDEFKDAHHQFTTPVSISDSIISMGGVAPIKELIELAKTYDGYLYIDDAHGTSILGKHGCGYTLNLLEEVFSPRLILAASMSKGFGTNLSAIVLPTKQDIDMIRTYCTPFIFSNPPPLAIVESSIVAADIHLSDEINALQKKLWSNVSLFDGYMGKLLENHEEISPIRRIMIGDEMKAIHCASELKNRGYLVSPAMFPTVRKGEAILRVVISALHTEQQIADFSKEVRNILG